MKRLNKTNIVWIVLIVVVYLLINSSIALGFINSFTEITLVNILLNIILAVGLNLIVGVAGQFSLGHAGFMAIGAYATAIISKQVAGMPGFFVGMLVGMLIAGLVAFVVGMPTLRLTGDYLAIATLGTSEIIRVLILVSDDVTNGASGIKNIPANTTWYIAFLFVVLTSVLVFNYMRSSEGRVTKAIRENEIAAEAMGVQSLKYKVIAFVIGGVTASIAGALYVGYFSSVSPVDFELKNSIEVLIIVVFGGIGSMTGSIISATALGVLNMYLQQFGALRMVIYAVMLIAIMIFKPSGLLGTKELTLSKWFSHDGQTMKGGGR